MAGGRAPYQKEWRTLDWLPGYEVSEDGDLRHTTRKATRPAGYVLKGCISYYRLYKLGKGENKRIYKAHRLVCEAFHGPAPDGKPEVAHNDGNRYNNHYTNLRWASRQENDRDRVAHGTDPRGERNPRALLNWDKVREIRSRWDGTFSHSRELAEEYGLTVSGMVGVCKGRNWRER